MCLKILDYGKFPNLFMGEFKPNPRGRKGFKTPMYTLIIFTRVSFSMRSRFFIFYSIVLFQYLPSAKFIVMQHDLIMRKPAADGKYYC